MRIIDADELERRIREAEKIFYDIEDVGIAIDCIDATKTISEWHYPSRGEIPDKDWSKHPLNVSKKCFVLTKEGVGTIARWDNDYRIWFEKNPFVPVVDVIAWQYFVPPKEEA